MNIVPDWLLVALQTLPFLVAFLALRSLLFKPMLAYLDERAGAIDGAKAEAEQLRERVTQARATWDERFADARAEGAVHRSRLQQAASERRQAMLDEARAEADGKVDAAVAEIEEEHRQASRLLREQAQELATEIATRVLDRPVARA